MIGATLKLIGIKDVMKGLEEAKRLSKTKSIKALKAGSFIVEREAKRNVTVDRGRLRASLTHQIVGHRLSKVGTNVKYGKFVEFGTSGPRMAPVGKEWASRHGFGDVEWIRVSGKAKPFLTPALIDKRKEVAAAFKRELTF
jgi:HK97 gp10 family phage protein|tara:strand:- start:14 stop:436 length:423 start_codon:yes stop_codon:yes gene_type:complete